MLESLKCYPLLKGYRGQPGADLESLKGIILSLSRLAIDLPELQELDLNPVMAQENGAWCVDSRIVFD
jgi:acetyltransferase